MILNKKNTLQKTQVHNINVLKSNNDEGNITSFSQQKVESVNNDINYIKNSTIFSEKTNQTIITILYILFFLPLILMVLLSIILSVRNKNPLNLIDKKHKLAKKLPQKIKKANEFLKAKNYDGFYEEIEKSLWGYFSDKFKVDSINLSKDSINDYFTKHQISKDVKNQFIDLINRCELERYSPVSNKSEQVNSLLSEAEKIIINVEAELKMNKLSLILVFLISFNLYGNDSLFVSANSDYANQNTIQQ